MRMKSSRLELQLCPGLSGGPWESPFSSLGLRFFMVGVVCVARDTKDAEHSESTEQGALCLHRSRCGGRRSGDHCAVSGGVSGRQAWGLYEEEVLQEHHHPRQSSLHLQPQGEGSICLWTLFLEGPVYPHLPQTAQPGLEQS